MGTQVDRTHHKAGAGGPGDLAVDGLGGPTFASR